MTRHGTFAFTDDSIAGIETPVLLMSALRPPVQIDPTLESDRIAALGSADIVTYLPMIDASHFDFMGQCTENALTILAKEEPDDLYVCEMGTTERAVIHARASSAILEFFAEQQN